MSFIIFALVALFFVIIYQIAKASEYATTLRGEDKVRASTNKLMAWLLLAFLVLGMYAAWHFHESILDKMLPVSASAEGREYDSMFKATIILTGIVFFITQTLLFWFAFRYQSTEKRKPYFYPHNNKLELLWTTIPAIVMAVLVMVGLKNWFLMTSPAPASAQVVEIVGKQFNWLIRYPGADGELGRRNFRLINDANNVLGLDYKGDPRNLDDVVNQSGELHIVKGRPVKLIIGSRDVIHDVGLPHFRYKMDAVPGITTTIWFTPTVSTEEMKKITKNPNFVYEISCDQLCGKGHYSMRGTVIVHDTQEEFNEWMRKQTPDYVTNFANKPASPAPANQAAPVTDSAKKTAMK
ncbi:MAG: cytochrome c oxidase subunit II [Bacteroidetes bacterium]|nr:cytochrome c oxidase subunit II [Bacteroidota bacterium]MBS1629826.1 cytochrome c oxidase subunit II [Bacteroidota bacterium]